MYWYKPWRETRTVTLLGMAAVGVACVLVVYSQQTMRDHADAPMTYIHYIWKAVYDSFGRDLFLLLAVMLGCGGLIQEKANGTSGFTLALPVSRARILYTRAAVGYFGVVAIALIPVVLLPVASRYVGQVYPMRQALAFSLLWSGAGAIFYGYTFLLAHVMEGEYTPMLAALASLMGYGLLTSVPWVDRIPFMNLFGVLNGEDMAWFNESRSMVVGPLPWMTLIVFLMVASAFVFVAVRRIAAKDF